MSHLKIEMLAQRINDLTDKKEQYKQELIDTKQQNAKLRRRQFNLEEHNEDLVETLEKSGLEKPSVSKYNDRKTKQEDMQRRIALAVKEKQMAERVERMKMLRKGVDILDTNDLVQVSKDQDIKGLWLRLKNFVLMATDYITPLRKKTLRIQI